MILNDIVQCRIVTYTTAGSNQIGVNVRHYKCTAVSGTGPTPAQVASALNLLVATHYKTMMSVSAAYRGVGAAIIWPLSSQTIEYADVSSAGAGTVAGDMLPSQISGLISLYNGSPGRHGRGRTYVPFPSEASSDASGLPSSTYQAGLGNIATDLTSNIIVAGGNGGTLTPISWWRSAHTGIPWVTTISRNRWATQRRRGAFGRANVLPF